MEHTPTPWRVETWTYLNGVEPRMMVQNDSNAIAQVIGLYRDNDDEQRANAAFIVEACNAHDALVEENARLRAALTQLSDWMREHTGPADGTLEMLTSAHNALEVTP